MGIGKSIEHGFDHVTHEASSTADTAGKDIQTTAVQAGKDAENPTDDETALDVAEVGGEVALEAAG